MIGLAHGVGGLFSPLLGIAVGTFDVNFCPRLACNHPLPICICLYLLALALFPLAFFLFLLAFSFFLLACFLFPLAFVL